MCCKGVWNDKPYPIYWYYETDNPSGIRYGEFLNGVHLWQKDLPSLGGDINASWKKMKDMFIQVGVFEDIEAIINMLSNTGNPTRNWTGKANLYFMVACINPITGSVLIAQRSKSRKHLKGVWDFGNVKYQNIAMKEIIESTYENLFGIKIDIIEDEMRGGNIKPFGYCTIYRNHLPHNGIMCYAFIQNPNGLSDDALVGTIVKHLNAQRDSSDIASYQNVRFISKAELDGDENKFQELTLEDIRLDSQAAPNNKDYTDFNSSIMYFQATIRGAIGEWENRRNM